MADQKHVPLDTFITVVKILSSQINDLAVGVMTLRAAVMQAQSVPISADELKRLDDFFRDYEPIRKAREAMENLASSKSEDMSEAIVELLKKFSGPIQ